MLKDVNIKTLEGISNIQDLKEISLIGCGLSQATPGINEIGKLGNLELLDMSDNNIDNISCMGIENLNNVAMRFGLKDIQWNIHNKDGLYIDGFTLY